MQQLNQHDLLIQRNLRLQKPAREGSEGRSINLNGIFVVDEEKLRKLDEKTAHEFAREGVFGWIYAHLMSLANLDRIAQRLDVREQAEAASSPTKN
jgi:hypothetical protein